MVEQCNELNAVFHALADPARRHILTSLRDGPKSISELAAPLDMSFAGAAKHIGVLERASLLQRRKHGRTRICSLQPDRLATAEAWLSSYADFWSTRLDRLGRAIEEDSQ